MSPSLLAVAGISLLLGFRHAFEPDHLAAVSTLATRQGSVWAACRLGLAWAVGHTASVGVEGVERVRQRVRASRRDVLNNPGSSSERAMDRLVNCVAVRLYGCSPWSRAGASRNRSPR